MTNPSGGAVIALARRAERRLVETLRGAGATSPDTAIPIDARRLVGVQALKRLQAHGVVVDAGHGEFWLEESALDGLKTQRKSKAGWVIGVVVIAAVAAGALLALQARSHDPAPAAASAPLTP